MFDNDLKMSWLVSGSQLSILSSILTLQVTPCGPITDEYSADQSEISIMLTNQR